MSVSGRSNKSRRGTIHTRTKCWLLTGLVVVGFAQSCELSSAHDPTEQRAMNVIPELCVAVADSETTVELHRYKPRLIERTTTLDGPAIPSESEGFSLTTTEVASAVETQIARYSISEIVAHKVDGTPIPSPALARELANPAPVIVVPAGQGIDPKLVGLFKSDAIVMQVPVPQAAGLSPPAVREFPSGAATRTRPR